MKQKFLDQVVPWSGVQGEPKREFLYVGDMASASVYVMNLVTVIYVRNNGTYVLSY